MNVDKERCTGCTACHPYCPMAAISLVPADKGKKSEVNQVRCVECGACLRAGVCRTDAIFTADLQWPRSVRPAFSNPHAAPLPGLKGAMPPPDPKTNEVSGRIAKGFTPVVVEVGRPGVSTSLHDVEKITMALASAGVHFDPGSSVTALMVDPSDGRLQQEVLDERVMHVMIHYTTPDDRLAASLKALRKVSPSVDTVFSIGFSNLLDDNGTAPAISIAEAEGFKVRPHAKTNVGLTTGREKRG